MITRLPPPDPAPLAPFAAVFDTPGFACGSWGGGGSSDGMVEMSYFQLSREAGAFVVAAYAAHWVRPDIAWPDFAAGPDYRALRGDPTRIALADAHRLAELLTTLIRGDRFNEGLLASAFDGGTLPAVARRMAVLAEQA
ncbi:MULTISPECIES: DUF6508 domain-containing protein [unclassified Sphingomonas]|uniref:DUF6508 domain-containing protein n=1 Tax=unclassified Sphingomonas TaxID=196159 RepID=UPI0006F63DF4|nr:MULTISPECIES: DUF6508 domain-containing protein [unclassified Sphingomonas]KQM26544.1 hypothetical protein ASE58_12600 [Sphingomonas sp. Leaf9]KQM42953.1 hypothetical protein ASE57_12605 [Sphingomonas sp. Leaf11]